MAIFTGNVQAAHQASVAQAATAGNSLDEITQSVTTIRDMNSQIASAAEEQTARAEEVKRNVERINEVTELSSRITERTSSASEHLSKVVTRLESIIGKFRLTA